MNYYEEFVKYLKEKASRLDFEEAGVYDILQHLIRIMGEQEFNEKFESYFLNMVEEETFDDNFYMFHKHMRQIDFYNNFYRKESRNVYHDIGGSLDMIFWSLIQISDKPYFCFKEFIEKILRIKYAENGAFLEEQEEKDIERLLKKYYKKHEDE